MEDSSRLAFVGDDENGLTQAFVEDDEFSQQNAHNSFLNNSVQPLEPFRNGTFYMRSEYRSR